jgi:hypothetical protein
VLMKTVDMAADNAVRQVRNRQYENATVRAYIGALLRLGMPVKADSLAEASTMVGSSPVYVAAMVTLIEAQAWPLIDDVIARRVALLEAAQRVRKRAHLVKAYRDADPSDRIALGKAAGVGAIWDEVVVPNI